MVTSDWVGQLGRKTWIGTLDGSQAQVWVHFTDSIFKDAHRPGSTGTNLCKHNATWTPHDAYMFSKLVGTTQVEVHVQIAPTNNTEVFPLPWCTKCKSIMETCGLLASAESITWPLLNTATSKVLSEPVSKVLQLTSGKEASEIAVFVGTIDSILMLLMSHTGWRYVPKGTCTCIIVNNYDSYVSCHWLIIKMML